MDNNKGYLKKRQKISMILRSLYLQCSRYLSHTDITLLWTPKLWNWGANVMPGLQHRTPYS